MYTIAICDDEKQVCAQLECMILQYAHSKKIDINVEVFYSGEELYRAVCVGEETRSGQIDLIFLDIELQMIDGISAGKKIRDELKNEMIQIAFISAKQSYAMQLFEVRPLQFLIKPLTQEKVINTVEKALELSQAIKSVFEFTMGKAVYRLPLHKIIYFESQRKKVHIVTETNRFDFYEQLARIAESLIAKDFIQIHQSYLVNYLHVVRFTHDSVELTNCEILPISKTHQKMVRKIVSATREEKRYGI